MAFAKVYAAEPNLLAGEIITVEVDILRNTLHNFSIVGLPAKAVDEGKMRISSAIKNSGFPSPKSKNQKTTVSLLPADLKKEGSYFDLAIALCYLLADEIISFDPSDKIFLGELSLSGEIKPLRGILPLVNQAKKEGFKEVYVPVENKEEAALVSGLKIFAPRTLKEIIDHLTGQKLQNAVPQTKIDYQDENESLDFDDIRGQETAKRGLALAAAGGHNVLMKGPPGTGKTLLARAFTSLLPPLNLEEILEVTSIHSVAGLLKNNLITKSPFRAPHHKSSTISIIGGGMIPQPGEITLAHRGVLFLDEFPEFNRDVLEALREPLEEKKITISRAQGRASFPANFILIAAMNPCPCGYFGTGKCLCRPVEFLRYEKKISGPILDRIDLVINVSNVEYEKLGNSGKKESKIIKEKVLLARQKQEERFKKFDLPLKTNSDLGLKEIDRLIVLEPGVRNLLNESARRLDLSPRSYHRVIKLAQTIADFEGQNSIKEEHLLEALQYRPKT